MSLLKRYVVLWYVVITVARSFSAYFLPFGPEQKSLLVPFVLVLVPTVVCIPLAYLAEGKGGLRRLFSRAGGGLIWLLIGALSGAFLRVAVLVTGLALGTSIQADLAAPGTPFIILATVPLAWFEELGWRRFALDRLLHSHSPIESALLIGLPWALIHLILLLPGMMSVGAPAFPQTLVLVVLSLFLTWTYVRSGGSLLYNRVSSISKQQ